MYRSPRIALSANFSLKKAPSSTRYLAKTQIVQCSSYCYNDKILGGLLYVRTYMFGILCSPYQGLTTEYNATTDVCHQFSSEHIDVQDELRMYRDFKVRGCAQLYRNMEERSKCHLTFFIHSDFGSKICFLVVYKMQNFLH